MKKAIKIINKTRTCMELENNENKGYTLVRETCTPFKATLTYKVAI